MANNQAPADHPLTTSVPEVFSGASDRPISIYVASRASVPERPAMWIRYRSQGWNICSTWIDEAGNGDTDDLGELWQRIENEIRQAAALILYAEDGDFPLKGALVEVGMAIGMGKPVFVVCSAELDEGSLRPLGSWAKHPLVTFCATVPSALASALSAARQSEFGRKKARLIAAADAAGDIVTGDDGSAIYWPMPSRGGMSEWMLRAIADELASRNAGWAAQLERDLGDGR
jgi:hypothetical protein